MSELTPRMQWPYPSQEDDPWFDTHEDNLNAADASAYSFREDRQTILAEGGTITWDVATSTLAWTGTLELTSPITGFVWRVTANSVTIANGEVLYVTLNRGPGSSTNVSFTVSGTVPSTDNDYVIAVRTNDRIYWRNGTKMDDGESFVTVGGGSGAAEYRDEGSPITTDPDVIDFVGGGVVASEAAGVITVTIPGGASDMRTAKIIVGNSSNGDVPANADFLDDGGGDQLVAALASATAGDDVFIRPGTYDLGVGVSGGPLTIPAGVRVWGTGYGVRIVTNNRDDMGAFVLNDDSSLTGVRIVVAVPVNVGSGSLILVSAVGNRCILGDIRIDFQGSGYTPTEAGFLAITSVIQTGALATDPSISNVYVENVPATGNLGGSVLTVLDQVSGLNYGRYSNLFLGGGDVGMYIRTPSVISNVVVSSPYTHGVRVAPSGDGAMFSNLEILAGTVLAAFQGLTLDGPTGAGFSNIQVRSIGGVKASATGIFVDNPSSRNKLSSIDIVDMGSGLVLASGTTKNVAIGGSVSGATTPTSDSGSLNDIAHIVT